MKTIPATITPQFTHDCGGCKFLGIVQGDAQFGPGAPSSGQPYAFDAYVCDGDALGETLIARYGDDGPEYLSAPMRLVRRDGPLLPGAVPYPLDAALALYDARTTCHWCKQHVGLGEWNTSYDGWERCPHCHGC